MGSLILLPFVSLQTSERITRSPLYRQLSIITVDLLWSESAETFRRTSNGLASSRPVEARQNGAHSFRQTRSKVSLKLTTICSRLSKVYYHFDSSSHEQYISYQLSIRLAIRYHSRSLSLHFTKFLLHCRSTSTLVFLVY